jgi:hypothetical protein
MKNPALAWTLIAVGVVLVLLSASANPLGLGQSPGFGWKKTLGVIIGALVGLAGLYLRSQTGGSR